MLTIPFKCRCARRVAMGFALGLMFLATGCGGFPVGPFPAQVDIGPLVIAPEDIVQLPAPGGIAGAFIPLCELPTRGEAEQMLRSQADAAIAQDLTLDRIVLRAVNLFAEEEILAGLGEVELYYFDVADEPRVLAARPPREHPGVHQDVRETELFPFQSENNAQRARRVHTKPP